MQYIFKIVVVQIHYIKKIKNIEKKNQFAIIKDVKYYTYLRKTKL